MTDSKRGRPALPDDQKRQQIGVRTSPSLKSDLEQAAAVNGRSVAQEAEWRLQQSIEDERRVGGEHTARLLRIVAAEIEEIESATGKKWSKDLSTWAAVARMFHTGPIRRLRPDRTSDDEVVMEAWNRVWSAEQEKRHICDQLVAAGVAATPELPEVAGRVTRKGGLFGSVFGNVTVNQPNRDKERSRVTALNADEADTVELMKMVDRLEQLDADHRVADADWSEAVKPYHEAEAKGHEMYQEMMRRRARELFQQGDYSLMGEAF